MKRNDLEDMFDNAQTMHLQEFINYYATPEPSKDMLDDFIQEIRNEFKHENWDYLDFVADRVRNKIKREAMEVKAKDMQEGFTGGEWKSEPSSNDVDFLIFSTNVTNPIAMTCEDGLAEKYRNKNVAEANAKLIANAPAMYEALRTAYETLLNDCDYRIALDDIEAVFKKINV